MTMTTPTTTDLRRSHLRMAGTFVQTAKIWRKIAHDAHVSNDHHTVRLAHKYALENEQWAKESELTAGTL